MFSIRNILIAGIVGLQLVSVGAVMLSTNLTTETVLVGHARTLMTHVSMETRQHAERYLSLARETVELTQRLANFEVIQREDHKAMERYFVEQLSLHPSFDGIYFGSVNGSFTYVKREEERFENAYRSKFIRVAEGSRDVELVWRNSGYDELARETDPDDTYDPRVRPWYRDSIESRGHIWTEPYFFFTSKKPGISSANPVYNSAGDTVGAVGVDIEIDSLSEFLASLNISENAKAFILNSNGDVIAYPDLGMIHRAVSGDSGTPKFTRIDEFGDPVARLAFLSLGQATGNYDIAEATFTSFVVDGETYLASFSPLLHPELPWSLGIYLPKDDFLGVFKENQQQNLLMVAGITVIACLLGIMLWRGIARPLTLLRAHARTVSNGDLQPPPEIRSAYSEIREMVLSFDRMVSGLRDRDQRNVELAGELQESEIQLRQAQKMEAMGQLTSGIAHDFNNLLGIVIGNLDFLRDALKDRPESRDMAERAIRAALRGADLTQRLLSFARRQRLKPEVIDLNALVATMTDLMQRTLGETIKVESDVAGDLRLARIDPSQMETALLNLAMNARHAMPNGGTLTVETRNVILERRNPGIHEEVLPGPYVMVTVGDTGAGMSSKVLTQVFEPFFTTKPIGEGSGLGLSMVHGFIKQSLGHIAIESDEGVGTKVRLYFPVVADDRLEVPDKVLPLEELRGNGETILVVEDDEEVRAVAVVIIESLGYMVLEAMDGAEALAALDQNEKVDLLFTDMVLPNDMNGAELATETVARRPGIKVLYTSGYSEAVAEHDDQRWQAIDLVPKPYRCHDLAQRLYMAIHQNNGPTQSGQEPK